MKVTISKLLNSRQSLEELAQVEMPIKTSYWVARLLNKVISELTTYEQKRAELVEKYGEKDKQGNLKQEGKSWEELTEKHKELLDLEVELDAKAVDLSGVDVNLRPSTLVGLEEFVTFNDNGRKEG